MRTAPLWVVLTLTTFGCGGGVPLLYPARTLATGDVRASGGGSATFIVGGLSNELAAGRAEVANAPPGIAPPLHDQRYAQAALVLAAVAPGVAPYVSARVGLGDRFEGGVTYTGRAAHLDVRRSFDWNDVSLSIGLGIETPIYGDSDSGALPQLDLSSIRGYGADVPIVIGWQSSARAYMLWVGGRVGWDHTSVGSVISPATTIDVDGNGPGGLSVDRLYGGGVVGLAAGFRHIHAALEIDVAYQTAHGTFEATTATVQGVSMSPAAALWWTF
jgi:hypothetical protein